MKKVLITTSSFGQVDEAPLKELWNSGYHVIFNPYGRKLTESEVIELLELHQPDGLLAGVEPLTETALTAASPGLKIISRCGTGLDSVDLDAAKKLGVIVTNTPDGPTRAVAELTVGLMLALLRRIHLSDASIRRGGWKRPMGNLLYGKKVGIIGCGRIGTCLAKMLTGFECTILGYDPLNPESEYYNLTELEELLRASHVITLHLPVVGIDYFIGAAQIKMMRQGSYLINAARGNLVDEKALYEALIAGHLAGAGIDTFEQEPYRGPLAGLENVLLTAHIGSYAREARTMMEKQAVFNLLAKL